MEDMTRYDATGSDSIGGISGAVMCYEAAGAAIAKRLFCTVAANSVTELSNRREALLAADQAT